MDQPTPAVSRPLLSREFVVQVVGYAGAAAGLAGTFAALGRAEDLTEVGALLVMLGAAVVLLAAGAWIGRSTETAYQRMRSVFWFVAVEAFAIAVQLFVTSVLELTGRSAAVVSALLVTAAAAALWAPLRRPLQQILLFLGLLGLLVAIVFPEPSPFAAPDLTATAVLIWLFGIGWAVLGGRGLIQPSRTAMVLGTIAAIVGPLLFTQSRIVGEILALATAVGVLWLGERRADRALGGLGIVGILAVVVVVVVEHLADSTGGTIGALMVGVLLLVGALSVAGATALAPPAPPTSVPGPPPGA